METITAGFKITMCLVYKQLKSSIILANNNIFNGQFALVTQCTERLVYYWQTRSTCASISIEKRDWFINRFSQFPVNSKLFPSTSQMKKILYSNDCTDCYLFVSNSISLKSRFRPSARESCAKQCQYALQTNQIYRCTLARISWSLGSLEKLTN